MPRCESRCGSQEEHDCCRHNVEFHFTLLSVQIWPPTPRALLVYALLGTISFQEKIRIGEKRPCARSTEIRWTGRGGCGNTPAGGKKEGRNRTVSAEPYLNYHVRTFIGLRSGRADQKEERDWAATIYVDPRHCKSIEMNGRGSKLAFGDHEAVGTWPGE